MKFAGSISSSVALGLTTLSLLTGVAAFQPDQTFENLEFVRTVDLTGSYVKESVQVDVKNTGNKPVQNYYYALSTAAMSKVGIIEGRENKGRIAAISIEPHEKVDAEQ